tara:strand:- start:1777 stop:2481 length:705 start_codon:yes stop_codon:yes gene_type:complete
VDNISLIIPLYNEESRIKKNLSFIQNFLKKKNIEVIFVNDGSSDNSEKIIKKFISKNNKKFIKYLSYKQNVGKGYAIKKGVLSSKKRWILICDLDMSVQPSQINIWYKKKYILKKNEAYFASRKHTLSKIKTSFVRKLLGVLFNLIIFSLFGIRIKDTQCGFKLFHKDYAKSVFRKISSYRFSFDVELVLLLKEKNIKIKELPVNWIHKSGSKLNIFYDMPLMFYDLLKIRFKN